MILQVKEKHMRQELIPFVVYSFRMVYTLIITYLFSLLHKCHLYTDICSGLYKYSTRK